MEEKEKQYEVAYYCTNMHFSTVVINAKSEKEAKKKVKNRYYVGGFTSVKEIK